MANPHCGEVAAPPLAEGGLASHDGTAANNIAGIQKEIRQDAIPRRLTAFVERQTGVRVRWKRLGGSRDLHDRDVVGYSRGWMRCRSGKTVRSRLIF